jgi:hypothetical protein
MLDALGVYKVLGVCPCIAREERFRSKDGDVAPGPTGHRLQPEHTSTKSKTGSKPKTTDTSQHQGRPPLVARHSGSTLLHGAVFIRCRCLLVFDRQDRPWLLCLLPSNLTAVCSISSTPSLITFLVSSR